MDGYQGFVWTRGGMNLRIQNNGVGIQSTVIFLMAHEGLIPPIDYSIFADTQEEPAAVYQHLAWLRTVPEPVPLIITGTAGKLGDSLLAGCIAAGQQKKKAGADGSTRFASIPSFTAPDHKTRPQLTGCNGGMVRRQCTRDYKIDVVEKIIREILGLKPRQRVPNTVHIEQVFGISWDERSRAERIKKRFEDNKRGVPDFPLLKDKMTRDDCKAWLKGRVPHEVPRSACVFCPFKSATEWLKTKANPEEWARALEIDRGIRATGAVVNRNMDQKLYLHRQCIPLEMVDLEAQAAKEAEKKRRPLFELLDCGEGMCGV